MGVTIRAKKDPQVSCDMPYSGFSRLRQKISNLYDEEWGRHYAMLQIPSCHDDAWYEAYDKETEQLIAQKRLSPKVVDFCMQSDCDGRIRYGACKQLLNIIGDASEDDTVYGYAGWKNPSKMCDFVDVLNECVNKKCDLIWN